MKKGTLDDQFEFFIKSINEAPEEQKIKHCCSERFLNANRFLPDDLFGKKKVLAQNSGPLCDPVEQQKYFALSEDRSKKFFESQKKIVKLMEGIDQREKRFLIKALRTE